MLEFNPETLYYNFFNIGLWIIEMIYFLMVLGFEITKIKPNWCYYCQINIIAHIQLFQHCPKCLHDICKWYYYCSVRGSPENYNRRIYIMKFQYAQNQWITLCKKDVFVFDIAGKLANATVMHHCTPEFAEFHSPL